MANPTHNAVPPNPRIRFVGESRWNWLTVLFGAAFILTYVFSLLAQISSSSSLGVHCLFSTRLLSLDATYLSPENQTLPPEGCHITAIGGQKVTTWPSLLRLMASADSLIDEKGLVSLQFGKPNGEEVTLTVSPREQNLATLAPTLAWLVPKMALVAVAGALLWRSPHAIPRQFFLLSMASLMGYLGGFHWMRISPSPWLFSPFLIAAVFLPVVSLHFNLIFPRQNQLYARHRAPFLLALYIPPALFAIFAMVEYWHIKGLSLAARDAEGVTLVENALSLLARFIHFYMAFGFLCYLAGIFSLVNSFRNARSETERNQVKWILYGSFMSTVPLAYSLYLVFFDTDRFGQGGATWPMFMSSICMTVAYSISLTGYGLMQIDRMLSTGFLRFLTSALVGAGYYLVVLLTFLVVGQVGMVDHSWPQAVAGGIAALLIAILLDIARSRLKRLLDRRLRRDRQILEETLQQMTKTIDSLMDEDQLAKTFLPIAVDLIRTRSGAVYLAVSLDSDNLVDESTIRQVGENMPKTMRLRARFGRWHGPESLDVPRDLQNGQQVTLSSPSPDFGKGPRNQASGLLQPLVHDGKVLGALFLADPLEGPLTMEEKAQIQALAQVASLALASTRGYRLIDSLSRELQTKVDKIAEQQRRILSLQTQLRSRVETPDLEKNPTEEEATVPQNPGGLIGSSLGIQRVLTQIQKVAPNTTTVLILGESGTGKELVAQAIHENSPRSQKPFVRVHCGALSPTLLESELFGHVRGAFTNAFSDKVGRFEAAQGGTIFLDEIGDISPDLQVKLLRVLQERTIERVGSNEAIKVDVRVLAATHRNLEQMVSTGMFRQDLFYRLHVFPIVVPPLRERIEDIPELVQAFISKSSAQIGRKIIGVEDDALAMLKSHDWPGNVRELQHCVESAAVLAEFEMLTEEDFRLETRGNSGTNDSAGLYPGTSTPRGTREIQKSRTVLAGITSARSLREGEEARQKEEILHALQWARGNKSEAARKLKIPRSTLVSQLKKFGLD